jgi:hypothetical protein
MLNNEEKIQFIINELNNLKVIREGFIKNEPEHLGKYILEDELAICDSRKAFLLSTLEGLGGQYVTID